MLSIVAATVSCASVEGSVAAVAEELSFLAEQPKSVSSSEANKMIGIIFFIVSTPLLCTVLDIGGYCPFNEVRTFLSAN